MMDASSAETKEKETVSWIKVVVEEGDKKGGVCYKDLFIPYLPSRPDTWGKESVGGWNARLPENLPVGTIVFFITQEDKKASDKDDGRYPFYFAFIIREKEGNQFVAKPLPIQLEDYEKYVRLKDKNNPIYDGGDPNNFYDFVSRERILAGDYKNRVDNPFQLLSSDYGSRINILFLTPESQEFLKKELAEKITR